MMLVFCCDLFARDKIGFPERIISLGPAVTEKLYLLEAGDGLIANTLYCQRPHEAKNKEKIGTVTKADMEKVVALKPDLALATSLFGCIKNHCE